MPPCSFSRTCAPALATRRATLLVTDPHMLPPMVKASGLSLCFRSKMQRFRWIRKLCALRSEAMLWSDAIRWPEAIPLDYALTVVSGAIIGCFTMTSVGYKSLPPLKHLAFVSCPVTNTSTVVDTQRLPTHTYHRTTPALYLPQPQLLTPNDVFHHLPNGPGPLQPPPIRPAGSTLRCDEDPRQCACVDAYACC